jgi:hypothetical protein
MIASRLYPQVKTSRTNKFVIMKFSHGNVSSAREVLGRVIVCCDGLTGFGEAIDAT